MYFKMDTLKIMFVLFVIVGFSDVEGKKKKKKKHHPGNDPIPPQPGPLPNISNPCQNFIKDKKCFFHRKSSIVIDSLSPCIFNCTYNTQDPVGPIRMSIHLQSDPTNINLFISARQTHLETSWTLPITFPEQGTKQRFTSIEEILCPPTDVIEETLLFNIATMSASNVTVNISLSQSQYKIKLNEKVTVTATPVSSWFKFYDWNEGENSVLITADNYGKNGKSVCALLSLQNAQCPVQSDKKGIIGSGSGRYQSFQERGGIIAYKTMFPDGVFIVLLPLPDDSLCTDLDEDFDTKTKRSKTTRLQVVPHHTIGDVYGIFLVVGLFLTAFVVGSTVVVILCIHRNAKALTEEQSSMGSADDDERLIGSDDHYLEEENTPPIRRTITGGLIYSRISDQDHFQEDSGEVENSHTEHTNIDPLMNLDASYPSDGFVSGGILAIRNNVLAVQSTRSSTTDETRSNHSEVNLIPHALVPTSDHNPSCVYWWKVSSEYSNVYSVGETNYYTSFTLVAGFMALTLSGILKSYLQIYRHHGSEDQCYFNTRCIVSFGILLDFSRIFTNCGYLLCAGCFSYILKMHRRCFWKVSRGELLGVSRNYELFQGLAAGLGIQFLMSGLYHTCPNVVTLRFDMIFMYVEAIVLIIGIWGLRHDNVSPHVYPTMNIIGMALLVAMIKDWVNVYFFWSIVLIIQSLFTFTISIMLYKTATWSFSPIEMIKIWKKWKPLLKKMSEEILTENTSTNPWTLLRMIVGIIANLGLVGSGFGFDMEIYAYILAICVLNMGLYILNYLFTKVIIYC